MSNVEIVDSLRSLYPLKDFEEEAVMEVVAEFRQLKEKATAKISPCPNCGSIRSLGDGFCYDCGTTLGWSEGKE